MTIRDARPEDAPFETEVPQNEALYRRLIDCEQREDLLYSYKYTRMAEMDGRPAGALLSYSGEYYLDSLAVHPHFRKQGIGRALLEDGIRKGRDAGNRPILLKTRFVPI